MSSDEIVLRAKNISKCFEMYTKPVHRLFQTLFMGRRQFYQEFWALRNINLEVKRGECIGIIGRNGAGKSTLLQIITGTLMPTSGTVEKHGRITALLELGSGFNPEYTGMENIYLNGTILGMTRREIDERLPAILEFADIGDFVRQPVKVYSSGMLVRLAFAVQTQINPDILIVDEALAVGDAAFQIKCMAHMQKLMDNGVTVIFVSHSVQTVRTFCDRVLWLDKGRMRMEGSAPDVTGRYMEFLFSGQTSAPQLPARVAKNAAPPPPSDEQWLDVEKVKRSGAICRWGTGEVMLSRFAFFSQPARNGFCFEYGDKLTIQLEAYVKRMPEYVTRASMGFSLRNKRGIDVIAVSLAERDMYIPLTGEGQRLAARFSFVNVMIPGEYMLIGAVQFYDLNGKRQYFDYIENLQLFQVVSDRRHMGEIEPITTVEILNS